MLPRSVLLAVSLLMGAVGFGQLVDPVTLTPATPTDRDFIRALIITWFGACNIDSETVFTVVTGNVVRTTLTFNYCEPFPAFESYDEATFGPLPAGTYVYEVYYHDTSWTDGPVLLSTQPLVVSAAPAIPALGSASALTLAALLAGISVLLLRRVGS